MVAASLENEPADGLRVTMVLRLYSGLAPSIVSGVWAPFGLPDVYKLLEELSHRQIPTRVIFLCREEEVINPPPRRQFAGLHIKFETVPAYRLPRYLYRLIVSRRIAARIARVYNDLRQFARVRRMMGLPKRGDIAYVDRRNIVLAAQLNRCGWRTIVRFHGVADWNRFPSRFAFMFWQPMYYRALRTPFDLVLSSEDGSPVRQFFDRFLLRSTPYRIAVNGVDVGSSGDDVLLRQRYGLSEAWPIMLFVGRLTADKGAQAFIDGLVEVGKQRYGFYAIIVAGGSDIDWASSQLSSAGLSERCVFERSLPHSDILALYRQADVFVSTNRLANLTNTILEAMAAGMCIVMLGRDSVTHADVSTEALVPEDVVVRIPREAGTQGVVDALSSLVQDPELIDDYKARLREFASSFLCSWEKRVAQEIALFNSVAFGKPINCLNDSTVVHRGLGKPTPKGAD